MPQGLLVEHACAFLRIIANLVGNVTQDAQTDAIPYEGAECWQGRLVTSLSALISELIG